jgi:hypothetical protein
MFRKSWPPLRSLLVFRTLSLDLQTIQPNAVRQELCRVLDPIDSFAETSALFARMLNILMSKLAEIIAAIDGYFETGNVSHMALQHAEIAHCKADFKVARPDPELAVPQLSMESSILVNELCSFRIDLSICTHDRCKARFIVVSQCRIIGLQILFPFLEFGCTLGFGHVVPYPSLCIFPELY